MSPSRDSPSQDSCTSKLYYGSRSSVYPPPPPPAKPTLLQYYCTTIAQYTPAHRALLFMPYTINIGDGKIVWTRRRVARREEREGRGSI